MKNKPEISIVTIISSLFLPKGFKDRKSWICYVTIEHKQKMNRVNQVIKEAQRNEKLNNHLFIFLKLI